VTTWPWWSHRPAVSPFCSSPNGDTVRGEELLKNRASTLTPDSLSAHVSDTTARGWGEAVLRWEYCLVKAPHIEVHGREVPGEHPELRPDVAAIARQKAAEGWTLVAVYPDTPGAQLYFKRLRTPAQA
jgi:hypothetical protein